MADRGVFSRLPIRDILNKLQTPGSLALGFALRVFKPPALGFMDDIDAAVVLRNGHLLARRWLTSRPEAFAKYCGHTCLRRAVVCCPTASVERRFRIDPRRHR